MFVIDSQVRWGSLLHIKSRNDNYNIGCYNKVKEARCKKKPKKRRGMSCCCKFKLGNGIAKCFGVFKISPKLQGSTCLDLHELWKLARIKRLGGPI
jgi:hypothetical protein